jgi:murein DD-endopeptidase MepM/ murein hydrolase activator NlpD
VPVPEQAALPAEPQRVVLEQQEASLADMAARVDQQDTARAPALGAGDGTFIWPVVFEGRPPITQPFGCTDLAGEPYSPDCATHRFHTGIDLGVPTGTPVYAAAPGVAHVLPSDGGYGNLVLIAHGNGWFTLYAHLSRFVVHDGDVVRRGALVGRSGSTGFSTGPHLHFEIRSGQRPVDPCIYLDC